MSKDTNGFVRVASVRDLTEGKPRAVKVAGRSIALYEHNGKHYATDNQCPHMGYPLTRGRVRNGVLTCDWHGWSYDMGGGGCFTGGCDDLDTFPVEVRDGEVYVSVAGGGSKRSDAHFLLLKEGLFSTDPWTLSKAIAIMLAQGVSEDETLRLILHHAGRHIATDRDANGGGDEISYFINGIKVARRFEGDDRLIPLMFAAHGPSGRAGDRPTVQVLPGDQTWERLAQWIRVFSADKKWEGIEKCLITARRLGGADERIFPLLYECAVAPHFLGNNRVILFIGYLAEILEEFGWDKSEELICNLAAKILGQERGLPDDILRAAVLRYEQMDDIVAELVANPSRKGAPPYDEDAFVIGLVSGDMQQTFDAVSNALESDAGIDRLVTTMVVLAGDRMARTPVNMNPGWGGLSHEMRMASSVRTALKYGGTAVAARALYQTAWQFYGNRWLNVSPRDLREPLGSVRASAMEEDSAIKSLMESIETIQIREIGRRTRDHLNSGFSGVRLLTEMAQTILKDDNGRNILGTMRTIFDEWELCADHPARNQMLVGLARWATDSRRSTGNQSATQTAQRFAKGQTAVELYEE